MWRANIPQHSEIALSSVTTSCTSTKDRAAAVGQTHPVVTAVRMAHAARRTHRMHDAAEAADDVLTAAITAHDGQRDGNGIRLFRDDRRASATTAGTTNA